MRVTGAQTPSGDVQWAIIDISVIDCPRTKERGRASREKTLLVSFHSRVAVEPKR